MDQTIETTRTGTSLIRIFIVAFPLIGLTGCVSEHVRDIEWCRNLETAKPLIDETDQAKLNIAMAKNKCAAKLLEAKKAAEKAAKLKASKSQPAAPKQTIKKAGAKMHRPS